MKDQLKDLFKNIDRFIPTKFDRSSKKFTEENFPPVPDTISSSKIVINKGYHFYNNIYRADFLNFFASKESFKYLGLAILSLIFNDNGEIFKLKLTHPDSEIKEIQIEFYYHNIGSYVPKADYFNYNPTEIVKHPWIYDVKEDWSLPGFFLTSKDIKTLKDNWEKRDVVLINSSDHGLARLAKLFLDISNPNVEIDEIVLEGDLGFKGVRAGSAEIRFNLPGNEIWPSNLRLI